MCIYLIVHKILILVLCLGVLGCASTQESNQFWANSAITLNNSMREAREHNRQNTFYNNPMNNYIRGVKKNSASYNNY